MEKMNAHNTWTEKLKPFLETVTQSLLEGLEGEGILKSVTEEGKVLYRLNAVKASSASSVTATTTTADYSFEHLHELRNTLKAVYSASEFSDAAQGHNLPLSKLFEKLEQHGFFKLKFSNRNEILTILDTLDNLSGETGTRQQIIQKLDASSFRPSMVVVEMLEQFGFQKVQKHFAGDTKFSEVPDDGSDLKVLHPQIGRLDFIFKLRRGEMLPDSQTILSALKLFESDKAPAFVLIILFTHANAASFSKMQFQFRQLLLNEYKVASDRIDRIKFIPIWTSNLRMLDDELELFKKAHIADSFKFEFKDQPAPRGFPDRNDHFLDRTFEVGKTEFQITIDPGETKFWRFGLRMVKDDDYFPPLTEGRHSNEEIGDVHICVGEPVIKGEELVWGSQNILEMAAYSVQVYRNEFRQATNYQGQVVRLIIRPVGEHMTEFRVFLGEQQLGSVQFVTSPFKYCRLGAWCDRKEFHLKTEIKVRFLHNVLY